MENSDCEAIGDIMLTCETISELSESIMNSIGTEVAQAVAEISAEVITKIITMLRNENEQLKLDMVEKTAKIEKIEEVQEDFHERVSIFMTDYEKDRRAQQLVFKEFEEKQKQYYDELGVLKENQTNAEKRINLLVGDNETLKAMGIQQTGKFKEFQTQMERVSKEVADNSVLLNVLDQRNGFEIEDFKKLAVLESAQEKNVQPNAAIKEYQREIYEMRAEMSYLRQELREQILPIGKDKDNHSCCEVHLSCTVENIDQLQSRYESPPIYVHTLLWNINIVPKHGYLGFFLRCNDPSKSSIWSCNATAVLCLKCHKAGAIPLSYTFGKQRNFNAKTKTWGRPNFIQLKRLLDPGNGFVQNNSIDLEVKLTADKPTYVC